MRDFILLFVLLIACHTNIGYGQKYSDEEIEMFNKGGLIKSVTERTYDIEEKEKFGDLVVEKTLLDEYFTEFNKKGQIVEKSIIVPLINEDSNKKYILNEKGHKIGTLTVDNGQSREWSFDIDDEGNTVQAYEIDSNGNKVKSGGPTIRDKNGNRTYAEFSGGTVFTFVYDDNNNRIESNYYQDDELQTKNKYEFNSDGNLYMSNKYYSDGSLEERHVYEYYPSGKKMKDNKFYSDKELINTKTYDELGNEIKSITYSEGKVIAKSIASVTYDYNKNGNWIKRTNVTKSTSIYDNGDTEIEITERILEYY